MLVYDLTQMRVLLLGISETVAALKESLASLVLPPFSHRPYDVLADDQA